MVTIGQLTSEITRYGKMFAEVAQKLFGLAQTQSKHAELINAQAQQIATLQDAVKVLQAREEVLLAKASQQAAQTTAVTVTDLARRIGLIEGQTALKT
jgi:hypothetical protein